MKKILLCFILLMALPAGLLAQVTVTGSSGADNTYARLALAFTAINGTAQTGNNIIITITANTTETAVATLNVGAWASLVIYPTVTGLSIGGNLATPLIDLNGAGNVTIDGRLNETGSTKDLTITNTSTSNAGGTSTIRFINDASNNLVQYCTLKGSATATTSGVLLFNTTTATSGNDGNTIDNNNITNAADANRPINGIYSVGTAAKENSENIISNNYIYDFLKHGTASFGINLGANTTAWTISDNSFYETASFAPAASIVYYGIYINNTSGVNFSVSGNYIGGRSASCGGSAWTKTNAYNNIFTAVYLNVGTGTASDVQGNTIKNFDWSNSSGANWTGINIAGGDVNVGTSAGNAVGDTTATGSITLTSAASGAVFYGINIAGSGTVDCRNNNIGAITLNNTDTNASNFYGISYSGTGTSIINYNKVGSHSTASSINASSGSTSNAQTVYGIFSSGSGTVTISNDTIANLTNGTTNTTIGTRGLINGITSTNGTNTISHNTIHDLTIANGNNAGNNVASAGGIVLTTATLKTVSGNIIYNLSNTYSSFAGTIIGLYFTGNTGANIVKENFIHSLLVTGASSTAATIYGIRIGAGAATYSNNIITIGGNTATTIYGIYETGGANNNNNLYFNTIYLGGNTGAGATNLSYALYSAVSTNVRDFRNNLFINTRSTPGGANLHYAAFFLQAGGTITCDYNDYQATGTGSILGYYAANRTRLPIVTAKDVSSLVSDPAFTTAGGTAFSDYIPANNSLLAKKGTGITTDFQGVTRNADYPAMGAFEIAIVRIVDVYNTGGDLLAGYSTLKAAFDAINAGTLTGGGLEIRINGNTSESGTAVLNASGTGPALYDTVKIYPAETGITISGNLAGPLINLNGADRVTIDGRVFATGTDKELTITNVNTSNTASTIQFTESAETDTVKYCTIKGSATGTGVNSKGIIFFSTATTGNGNDNIIIENNNITSDAAGRPINAIYSSGSAGFENSGNIIRNNNIYDFLKHGTASYGINLGPGTTAWTISGNSFFETASFVPTASVVYTIIQVNNTSGTDFIVKDNFVGGQSASCGGSAWTKTNAFNNTFTAININAGTVTASSVQNNTITNFDWSNTGTAAWTAINIAAGDVNIGTITGNIIGASTGTGSIISTSATTGAFFYGINIAGTGSVNCQNNNIGSITTVNISTNASNFYGIIKTAVAGTTTISNNIIGSTTTAGSINASSASTGAAQSVIGISNAGTGTVAINTNTIANITNGTTNSTAATAGVINGIVSSNGTNTISGNIIRDLTIANANTSGNNTACVGGIVLTGATPKNVTGNMVYNLSNTYDLFAGNIFGLYYTGNPGANSVSENFIHSLSVSGATSNAASIYGIRIVSGSTTWSNNIISLGGNSATTLYGIYETGTAGNNNSLYYNTVYIGGTPALGTTNKSYALYSAVNTNTRDFRNNIFMNARSTDGGSNLHYAAYIVTAGGTITCDYNDYYVSGTGGTLGYYGANKTTLPVVTAQDGSGFALNPAFAGVGGTTATDYVPSAPTTLLAATGTGITTDYDGGAIRSTTAPSMGAFDVAVLTYIEIYKSGVMQGGYSYLKGAFDAINAGSVTGTLEIRINRSTTENVTAVLNASGSGSSNYSSLNIYPTITGITISGNMATPLIDLNGADNVTIDGRVNATGTTKDMIITNTSTAATAGTSTIRFINDASNNIVKYCTLKGSSTNATSGILFFSTTTGTTGNDGNTIDNNNITSSADADRPLNTVYSAGTASFDNSGNIISNNNIYDFLNRGTASNGMSLGANTTSWDITGNSFYETNDPFVPTASVAYNVILINNASGFGYNISGNFIGGQATSCGGSAWTKTIAFNNIFNAISLTAGAGTASSIQNNTIRNIDWSNSTNGNWTAIAVAGLGMDANIGTATGNVIGASSGTGSIKVTATTSGAVVYGINISGTGTIDCQKNNIGAITAANASDANATNFYGINKTALAGTITISNNTIGSTTTAASINASSGSTAATQSVYGVNTGGTGTVTISGNTIANLTNGTSNSTVGTAGLINGITSTNGTNTISGNTVRDLTIANASNNTTNSAAAAGIVLTGATLKTVTGNTIYNLSNTFATFTGAVTGLYFTGSTGANIVSENFIHSLTVAAGSTAASVFGVRIGAGNTTWSNNIISLGGNTSTTIYGIYETGLANNNNYLYYNTIYISGNLSLGATNRSYALNSAVITNTRNFRNNLFINSRSTPGGSNLHYAAYIATVGGTITCDYNDYRATGTGGTLGYYGANRTILPVVAGQDVSSLATDPLFASAGGTVAADYVPLATTLLAITGTGITTDYDGGDPRSSTYPAMGAFEVAIIRIVDVYQTGGDLLAGYSSLKGAFDALNAGTLKTGNFDIRINANTSENGSAVLYQSGYLGISDYSSVTIYPTLSGIIVSGTLAAPLISLNGADNVTIDGRVNATGAATDMIITNLSTAATAGTSTIRLIDDATSNTVKYCTIKGSSTDAAAGILFFSTAATGTTGNDGNTIDNNNITSSTDANRPVNAIYSAGTALLENSGNIISNNSFYNFLSRASNSYGINLGANTTSCDITGNSFYETDSFVPTASPTYNVIYINNASGSNFNVSGNFIGGQAASCGGSAWTKTVAFNNIFTAINLSVAGGTISSVQNNTIRNFNWTNSTNGNWTGINIAAGDVNVGTVTGNIIGASTGTGSITVTATTSGAIVYGINIAGAGVVDCQKNIIGSITAANAAANASSFYGIYKGAVAGTTTISNNTIGSTTTSGSINASSGSTAATQSVYGINNAGTGTVTISTNTVANLTNGTTNATVGTAGVVNGITSVNGTNTISDNIIRDLTIANANNSATSAAAAGGIVLTGATLKTVTGNTIYNLSNTYATFTGSVIGIYFTGNTGVANIVSNNFIHSLTVANGTTAAFVNGIRIAGGSTTYSNNIITLGGNTATTIYGIYETGAVLNNNNLFFNTIYIGGSLDAGAINRSYALYSAVNTNTRDFRNNIFMNARSTTGGSNLHYAAYIVTAGGAITCDYNNYYVSGTGGTLGYYGAVKTTLPVVTGQDGLSYAIDPVFALPGGTSAVNYIPSASTLLAVTGTGTTTDYAGTARSSTYPSMGAFEITITTNVNVYKSGLLQAGYSRLKGAFDAFNAGTLNTGAFEIRISSSTSESASAVLNASGTGPSNYASIIIFPTITGIFISGNLAAPLIDLNGADNVTIDGRVNGSGSTKDMVITNTSNAATAGTSTIRFINDATTNSVKYCTLKGSSTDAAAGILTFGTSTGTSGNDGNTIDNNNITSSADANRPLNAIYSAGNVSLENSGNIISNNNFYDFLSRATNSNGISVGANTTSWDITENSFYETAPFVPTASATHNVILINNASGTSFTISGNYIGGQAASCGGSAWTKTSAFNNIFTAINITAGTGTASSIQNNTIRNFNWSNSLNAIWTAISVSGGDVNVGTDTGNTIGASTGTGSISVTATTTGATVYGIYISGTGIVDCQKNVIGSVTASNAAANATSFYGIYKTAVAGTTTISNNTIGSITTAASINTSSGSTGAAQSLYGINNAGTGTVTINNNTIANLTNGTTNATAATAGIINGITSSNGINNISGNTVRDLTIANANNSLTNTASVGGIILTGATLKTVTGNTIYNLSNTYASFAGGVTGMYFTANTGANIVSQNFIHSLTVAAGSAGASVFGVRIAAGATTYSNNIITLGGNTTTTIYGIYETGAALNNNNLYYNTVYIGGTPAAGALNSYAFYNAANTNTRDFRNNIFANERSNSGATGKHYAIYLAGTGATLTINKNDYFAPGTGGVLGFLTSDRTTLVALQTATTQDAGSVSVNPAFASAGGTTAVSYIPSAPTLLAATGTGITTDYAGTVRSINYPAMGAYEITIVPNVLVYKAAALQAGYTQLKEALDAINLGTHTGSLEIRITASTAENASAVLNASGTGGSNYSSVNIYPTITGITISGNLAAPLIDLNGADNITIDGRVGATGSTKGMIITNVSTSATAGTSTIRFINDATTNTIKYCTLKGSSTDAAAGILFFSSAGVSGNDGNTIDNNNITNSADANRPLNAIYSLGTATFDNSGNTISNNYFYDFLSRATASNAINLGANSTAWTITGNSFYETASFVPTAAVAYIVLQINNASGTGFTISGNYIGGQSSLCGGSAWDKTSASNNTFTLINLNVGTGTVSSIQNNTIRNFDWSNSLNANWTGINIAAGDVNIGTSTGNIIGASTGTGSISVTATTTGATVYGINIASTGIVDCQQNIIGSITAANALANSTSFYGINKTGVAGTTTISNNTIGSTSTAGSINASSGSTGALQSVFGINTAGTGTITISNNTLANLTNGTTNSTAATAGVINGITSTNGTNTISGNIIRDLTIANANNSATNTASAGGIALTGATLKTVTGNTIYNLSNTYSSFAGSIFGLYFTGSTGANIASENFIHNLTVASGSTTASVYGIKIAAGATTWSNNIISLGGNTATTLYGIYETGGGSNNNYLYFNTVYIGGTLGSGITNKSFALFSAVTNNIRNFRNNIFTNARSTTGGSSLHYAAYFNYAVNTNLTLDYNDYYASGTGGVLGYYNGADVTSVPLISGRDGSSSSANPTLLNAGSTIANDYAIAAYLAGVTGTGITTDYGSVNRGTIPTMGAWEMFRWTGSTSNLWGTAGNWTGGSVPAADATIIFDADPARSLQMDADRSVTNIVNAQSNDILITNGHKLTIKGNLSFTNGAYIDATASSSTVAYAGNLAQTIEAGQYLNTKVYDLTIDNATGVTLNTDFTVDNAMTINSGRIFTIPAPRILTVTGTLTNSAGNTGLVIRSDANGNDAKLINNSSSVSATVELSLTGGLVSTNPNVGRYHYIVPPVQSMTIGNSIDDVKSNLGLTNFGGGLLAYDETKATPAKDNGWQYFDGYTYLGKPTTAFSSLVSSIGYNLYLTNNDKITFKGQLNGAEHSYSLKYTGTNPNPGWNLIGNPYPCNYDLGGVTELNNSDNVDNTVYYTSEGGFKVWNVNDNTGDAYSDIVAPMQGFFVKVTAAASLTMPVASKTATAATPSRSKGEPVSPKGGSTRKIKLVLNRNGITDATTVCLFDDATTGFDGDHDAYKLFGTSNKVPYIYTEMPGIKYAINAVKAPESDPVIIPVTVVIREQGEYRIEVPEFENIQGVSVVLKHGSVETKLNQDASYTFTSTPGTFTGFQLIFSNSTTGVETLTKDRLKTWYNQDFLYIVCPSEITSDKGNLHIYDVQGKPVYNNNQLSLTPGQTIQVPVTLSKGVYIVKVVVNNIPLVSKTVVL